VVAISVTQLQGSSIMAKQKMKTGQERKNFVGRKILDYLFDRDQDLALEVKAKATQIAAMSEDVEQEEILAFLDPWVRHALRDTSH